CGATAGIARSPAAGARRRSSTISRQDRAAPSRRPLTASTTSVRCAPPTMPRSRKAATAGAAATAAQSSAAATPTAGPSPREFSRLVGANTRAARKARGIMQKTLAAVAGLAPAQLCRCEQGAQLVKVGLLARLAAALDLAPSSLLPL